MLSIVFQKLRNKKWMVLCLLIGNLLMISITAAAPMYYRAALQRALVRNMGSYQVETGQNPGIISTKSDFIKNSKDAKTEFSRLHETEGMFDQLLETWNVPQVLRFSRYRKNSLDALPETSIDGSNGPLQFALYGYTNLEDHITILNGRMYSNQMENNVIEVVVNQHTFIKQQMMLDQLYQLPQVLDPSGNPYSIRVVGVFKKSMDQAAYWVQTPENWGNVCLMDQNLFRGLFLNEDLPQGTFFAEQFVVFDYTGFQSNQVDQYLQDTDTYQALFKKRNIEFTCNFTETMEAFSQEAQRLNTTIWVLLLPVFVLLAVFVFMVSRQMLEMEENEIAVYKSRGANKGQILKIYLLQSLCITLVSLLGGIPLSIFLCRVLGASNAFLEFVHRAALPVQIDPSVWIAAGIAAVFSVCTMVLPAFRYAKVTIVDHKRQKNRVGKRPWWQIVFLDFIALGVSVYGLYQYNNQKALLAQRVMEGEALDPLLYFCSSLFIVGCALVVLRLFPLLVKLIFYIGKKLWSPALYASFLRILRTRNNQGFLMVFLILTVAAGIYNAQSARTINANAEDRITYLTGADLVLQEVWQDNRAQVEQLLSSETSFMMPSKNSVVTPSETKITYDEPDFEKYLAMDGAQNVTKVLWEDGATASLENGKLDNVLLMGIHTEEFGKTANFKESLLPYHPYDYLNAISQQPSAILVSSNFRDLYGYEVGDVLHYSCKDYGSARGVIYGFVDYWPSYAPVTVTMRTGGLLAETDNFLIVAHLSQLQSKWGVTPYQVWIRVKDSTQFIYDYAQNHHIRYSLFQDANAQLLEMKNDPIFQGTNGILTIGFICILLMCSIGFLIYWILSIESRTLQFGIFRAMGMSIREIFTMLINEQVFITGVSIGAGVGIGMLTSRLFVPLVQIAYSAADQVIPVEIISQGSDYVRLFTVITLVIVLCLVVLGVLISRIKISQALKLGED